jgi:hypothetical protein
MDPRRESLYWREENNPGARPRRWSAQFRRGWSSSVRGGRLSLADPSFVWRSHREASVGVLWSDRFRSSSAFHVKRGGRIPEPVGRGIRGQTQNADLGRRSRDQKRLELGRGTGRTRGNGARAKGRTWYQTEGANPELANGAPRPGGRATESREGHRELEASRPDRRLVAAEP